MASCWLLDEEGLDEERGSSTALVLSPVLLHNMLCTRGVGRCVLATVWAAHGNQLRPELLPPPPLKGVAVHVSSLFPITNSAFATTHMFLLHICSSVSPLLPSLPPPYQSAAVSTLAPSPSPTP